jgi:hypothetical protein
MKTSLNLNRIDGISVIEVDTREQPAPPNTSDTTGTATSNNMNRFAFHREHVSTDRGEDINIPTSASSVSPQTDHLYH